MPRRYAARSSFIPYAAASCRTQQLHSMRRSVVPHTAAVALKISRRSCSCCRCLCYLSSDLQAAQFRYSPRPVVCALFHYFTCVAGKRQENRKKIPKSNPLEMRSIYGVRGRAPAKLLSAGKSVRLHRPRQGAGKSFACQSRCGAAGSQKKQRLLEKLLSPDKLPLRTRDFIVSETTLSCALYLHMLCPPSMELYLI